MSDTPDFLSDEPSSAPAVTPEAPAAPEPAPQEQPQAAAPVSYTHLTLPTKRIV